MSEELPVVPTELQELAKKSASAVTLYNKVEVQSMKQAEGAVLSIMEAIRRNPDSFDLHWDLRAMRGVLIIQDKGQTLELEMKDKQALFNLNIAMYKYYVGKQLYYKQNTPLIK